MRDAPHPPGNVRSNSGKLARMSHPKRGFSISYVAFLALVVGAILLMVGMNPQLRSRPGEPTPTVGVAVQVTGHTLTWTSSAVLAQQAYVAMRKFKQQQARQIDPQVVVERSTPRPTAVETDDRPPTA